MKLLPYNADWRLKTSPCFYINILYLLKIEIKQRAGREKTVNKTGRGWPVLLWYANQKIKFALSYKFYPLIYEMEYLKSFLGTLSTPVQNNRGRGCQVSVGRKTLKSIEWKWELQLPKLPEKCIKCTVFSATFLSVPIVWPDWKITLVFYPRTGIGPHFSLIHCSGCWQISLWSCPKIPCVL